MMVRNHLPVILWNRNLPFAPHGSAHGLSIGHLAQIEPIAQYMPHHGTAPCVILFQGASVREAHLCRCRHFFLEKPLCNLRTAHAVHSHGKNGTDNLRLSFIDDYGIFYLPALLIAQGDLSEHVLSGRTFAFKGCLHLNGDVLAVQGIDQGLECRVKAKGLAVLPPAVIAVIYGNELHSHGREHLAQIPPGFYIVPGKSGKVFHEDVPDSVLPDRFQHFLHPRPFHVGTCEPVITKFQDLTSRQFLVLSDIFQQEHSLMADAGALFPSPADSSGVLCGDPQVNGRLASLGHPTSPLPCGHRCK
jgi:hypothetical protein